MTSKNETAEPLKDQDINYFRVIWKWKWAAILIPLVAMITAKLMEKPMPEIYASTTNILISAQGTQISLSGHSFESIAFMPEISQKIIDQLSLKMADGTSMNQTTLTNQLNIQFPGIAGKQLPVKLGSLYFVAKNENPDLAKKIVDLWVRLVVEEIKKVEHLNYIKIQKKYLAALQKPKILQHMIQSVNQQHKTRESLKQQLFGAEVALVQRKSELSTYQKRLKTFSNSKVHFFPRRGRSFILEHDHSVLKNELPPIPSKGKKESSMTSTETTLHAALKGLIFNKELEVKSLEDKIHFIRTSLKRMEQKFSDLARKEFLLARKEFLGEPLKKSEKDQVKLHKGFISSISSVNEAAVNRIPIPRGRNTQVFLAGLISLGLVLLACVLKAHIDAMRQE